MQRALDFNDVAVVYVKGSLKNSLGSLKNSLLVHEQR